MDAEGGGALVGCLRFVLLCKLGLYYAAHSRYEVDESTQHEGIHPGVLVPGGGWTLPGFWSAGGGMQPGIMKRHWMGLCREPWS